jgi:hypothetical protein
MAQKTTLAPYGTPGVVYVFVAKPTSMPFNPATVKDVLIMPACTRSIIPTLDRDIIVSQPTRQIIVPPDTGG